MWRYYKIVRFPNPHYVSGRIWLTTHRQHWESRETRRRNICTPKSCGSSGLRTDSRSAASSSASSRTRWWCPGRGPSSAPRSCPPPSSSTASVGHRIGSPGWKKDVLLSDCWFTQKVFSEYWGGPEETIGHEGPVWLLMIGHGVEFGYYWIWHNPSAEEGVCWRWWWGWTRAPKKMWILEINLRLSSPRNNLAGIWVLLISISIKLNHLWIFKYHISKQMENKLWVIWGQADSPRTSSTLLFNFPLLREAFRGVDKIENRMFPFDP